MERYVLEADPEEIEDYFDLSSSSGLAFSQHYNIAPGVKAPILIKTKNEAKLVLAEWGISNHKSEETVLSIAQEDVQDNGFFKDLVQTQPCIIPASGFYKWKKNIEDPLPFYLRVLSMDILAIPGIFSIRNDNEGKSRYSFTVLTMQANALVEPLDRNMPGILQPPQILNWLEGDAFKIAVKGLNGQHLLPHMAVYRVPDLVNDLSKNSPELIQPIPKLREDDDD